MSMSVPTLEGSRIRLRPLREDDAEALFVLHGDPRVMRYWSRAAWTDRAESISHLARMVQAERDGDIPWAIARREDDALIGSLSLFQIVPEHARGMFGYALQSACWGSGFALEAARLGLAHAFSTLGLERIEADIDPANQPSRRLAERLGFKQEGLLRHRWKVDDVWSDTVWYGLLREEFSNV
jgi:[ribosomal protein S5]-alanine N-acetyltransferase